MGEGLRGRPGHADRGGPGGAPAGPPPLAGRGVPRGRPRGRDGRRVRLLPARQGWRRAVDRHRHARARRRPPHRPPAPGLGDRAGHRRRRAGADEGVLRGPGRVGGLAASGVPARPGHRGGEAGQPAGHRGRPRRPRHHGLGRDLGGVRGALAGDHPRRRGVPVRARQGRALRRRGARLRGPARDGAARPRGRAGAGDPWARVHRRAAARPLHRQRRRPGLPGLRAARAPGGARHLLPRPLPAHQGPPAGRRPARARRLSRTSSPG